MTISWCVGGRHYSESINQNKYEKLNTKTINFVKVLKSEFDICGRTKSQVFTKEMTR